jgi:two-component system, chemotaxis family, protein-glutamate methylesterase/glutaminase
MIKVLIVEDSPVVQEFLSYILSSDEEIEVVGVSRNGAEALEAVPRLRPAVITMDIHMPVMDGFEATRRIMEIAPTPIVIVSGSSSSKEVASTFRAMEAGALAVALRPPGIDSASFGDDSRELIQTVKLMSEIKVVRRIAHAAPEPRFPSAGDKHGPIAASGIALVAIGASTGGPPALKRVLSGLPENFRFPILIVQHIASGFALGFAQWLASSSGILVHIASDGEAPLPGHAYLAPEGLHLGVAKGPRIELSSDPPENGGLRPSVAYLFRSIAKALGPNAVGILMTGMGRDGAEELKAMRAMGALTIAQDEASSIVFGMPGEAIKLGAATYVLPPEGIAEFLSALSRAASEDRP